MSRVYYNGQVYTGASELSQAFAEEEGVITAVGSDEEVLGRYAGVAAERVDLEGRFVCPGFNDSHMHLLNFGQALNMAQLAEHTDSLGGMMAYLRDYAAEHPPRCFPSSY